MFGFRFNLNDYVRDSCTGLKGFITARTEYLSRRTEYMIEALDSSNRPIKYWIDGNRLTWVDDNHPSANNTTFYTK